MASTPLRLEVYVGDAEIWTADDWRIVTVTPEGLGPEQHAQMIQRAEIIKSALEWAECLAECRGQEPDKESSNDT
jgi:hypothetical protein